MLLDSVMPTSKNCTSDADRRPGVPLVLRSAALVLLLAHAGCDTSFSPIQPSALHFSVYGFLDAAADTQFIRITPLRASLEPASGPLDATVTLADVPAGRTVTLLDSVFSFGGPTAHNFWTASPLSHGSTYRLSVLRSDGASSTATVTLPPAFPDPVLALPPEITLPPTSFKASVKITGVTRVAVLELVLGIRPPGGLPTTHTISLTSRVAPIAGGQAVQFYPYAFIYRQLPGCPIVEDARIVLAAAGSDWPAFDMLDEETLARPDVVTNIEDGVGFLGGLSTRELPWDALRIYLQNTRAACVQCTALRGPEVCFR